MLAGARGPEPFGSVAPWMSSASGKDNKNPGIQPRRQGGKYQTQATGRRSCFLGVETRPELIWDDWDLGREFTKTLVLKNIHLKLQKLHIRPPGSKFFSTSISQIVVLSPGTSFSMLVTFRPLQRCEYEDSIEFHSKEGSFQVCLRAILPHHTLETPESVMLPLCAVQHSSQINFLLKNISKLETSFQWDCPAPFQLRPEQGVLKPRQECHITAVFLPQEARVYQQQAHCRFGEEGNEAESCCTVILQGLAKYPYLQIRNPTSKDEEDYPVLHFGSVAVGQSLRKHFDLFNPSPVNVFFSLSRLPGVAAMLESEFSCDVTKGEVAPGGSLRATATYSPAVVDTFSVEYLTLKYRGALNETQLKLIGNCRGPKVSLSSSVVDFGCVEERGPVVQTVKLVNSSTVEAIYQWDIDCGNSVFSILPASGTVPPQSHTTLRAVYRPTHPMAHYRRVTCLILHKDPLFLDLIGTCYSELLKPAILKPEHLVLYKLHWYRRQDSSDSASVQHQDCDTHIDQQGTHFCTEEQSNQKPSSAAVMSTTPMEEFYQTCMGYKDPLSSSCSSSPHVSVVPNELWFNHKMASSLYTSSAFSQSVSITNHTRGKLSLVWTLLQDSPFSICPSSCDLAPLKSTSFRVTYDPKKLNTLHGAQLECFAQHKDSPDLRRRLLCPPWCVTVRVIGHSFQPGKEHFIPNCSLNPPLVVFPALGAISYRTVLLQNDGDLPVTFCLDHRSNCPLAESVCLQPSCGLIQPEDHQILTIRRIPTEDSPKQGFNLSLQLNSAKFKRELTVVSLMEKPCMSLESGSDLYFRPTAVGSQTQRTHRIRNLSHLPMRFQWNIPEPDHDLIFVKPDAGELHPNDSSVQIWSFSPQAEKTYIFKPTLTFWPLQSDISKKSHLTLEVFGMGSKGFLEAEKADLDMGETLVGSCYSVEVPLVNNSPCPVSFCLSVQETLQENHPSSDSEAGQSALQLDCERGTIASHSTMLIRSTFRPCRQAQYLWTISYQILNSNGFASGPSEALCEVRAKGVFPTLQVIDGCSGGSVGKLSKLHLWKLFSLDSLNQRLLSTPSPAELTFRSPIKHNCSVFTKALLDFNFSSAPLNSDPSNFVLMFHNPGSNPVDWAFLFPEDQQIELEYWAVTGEFSSTELSQMKVQDNQLFRVSPRSGSLLPGQRSAVHFRYSHDFVGTNRLPVVFKLSYGREIMLNFQGVTVERDKPYLHFASNQHVFTSVTIGDCSPPRQMYELHNGGAVPVRYEVDTAVLSQLQLDNFNHPVLGCLNPEGEVLPGKTIVLEWIFAPLEAKMYHMDVPIHIQNGESTLVRFEGCGVDAPTLSSSETCTCSDSKAPIHRVQRVPFPGQVLFLSEDSVFLGDIAVSSQSPSILFLTNVSLTDTVQYMWELPQQSNQQVVQMHPERGCLGPGDFALCVLNFTPTDYPTVYMLDLVCQVTQEAALAEYREALQRWEDERERQRDEFIITDKNVPERQILLIDKEPLAAPARKGPPLRKYKTLPPIGASSSWETVGSLCVKQTRAERRMMREKAKVWKRPVPPKPALLQLSVTAHSHGLLEYCRHFPHQYNRLCRYLQQNKVQTPVSRSEDPSLPAGPFTPPHGPERELVVNILSPFLRDILDDSAFIQSLIALSSKPSIYKPTEISPTLYPWVPSLPCPATRVTSSSPSTPQPPFLLNGTIDRKGTGESSENRPQMQSTLQSQHAPAHVTEAILMNTLQNLMMEVIRGELVLTAHPRSISLPPFSRRSRQMSGAMAEEDQ
ncbi:cilia- and flagella-associated protein 65 isoform 2-T2 [Odontesthes bonariensis]|uniref:cilia- and flagella-associated protein 65 isoform X2 n=1 Tax=Odontesthes bonariensis TaxID=219752 RepID=UPI003F5812B7